MNITITWEAVGAICTAMAAAATGLGFFVRSIVRAELAGFRMAFEKHKATTELRLNALEGRPHHRHA